MVNLLYYGADIVTCQTERSKMAALFMTAGQKAMYSTAYRKAFKFLDAGINLLGPDSWSSEYELSLNLHDNAAKAAYCTGNDERLKARNDQISANATSSLHLVTSYSLQIKSYNDKFMWEESVRSAVKILKKIGEKIDLDQTDLMVASEVQRTKDLIKGKSHQEIVAAMTEMKDERSLSRMMIYSNVLSASFALNPELYSYISARMGKVVFPLKFSLSNNLFI